MAVVIIVELVKYSRHLSKKLTIPGVHNVESKRILGCINHGARKVMVDTCSREYGAQQIGVQTNFVPFFLDRLIAYFGLSSVFRFVVLRTCQTISPFDL